MMERVVKWARVRDELVPSRVMKRDGIPLKDVKASLDMSGENVRLLLILVVPVDAAAQVSCAKYD